MPQVTLIPQAHAGSRTVARVARTLGLPFVQHGIASRVAPPTLGTIREPCAWYSSWYPRSGVSQASGFAFAVRRNLGEWTERLRNQYGVDPWTVTWLIPCSRLYEGLVELGLASVGELADIIPLGVSPEREEYPSWWDAGLIEEVYRANPLAAQFGFEPWRTAPVAVYEVSRG